MITLKDNDITSALPSLKQKFLVDLVNGIDVSRDHIKVQKTRDGFLNRLSDSLKGSNYRRQNQVNDLVVDGLESGFHWLSELTDEITLTNRALTQVSESLSRVKQDLSSVANFAAGTKEQLDNFQQVVDKRFSEIEIKIHELDCRQRAYQQVKSLFQSWKAGNFIALSTAQRCFLVITELSWGVFGDYCHIASLQDREEILGYLRDCMIEQLNLDAHVSLDVRIDSNIWLSQRDDVSLPALEYGQAVAYLGSDISKDQQPFTWFALNIEADRPTCVPYLMDASRLYKGMANDLIKGGYLHGV